MLSWECRKKLELDLSTMKDRKAKLFTDYVLLSPIYFNIQNRDKSLGEKELKLIALVDEFDRNISEAQTSRYELGYPTVSERLNKIESLLQQIEAQISQIEWK